MAAGQNGHEEWVGSAYLFVESSLDKVVLSDAYAHPQQKVAVYRALQAALAALLAQDPSPVPTLPGPPFPSQGRGHRRLKRVGGSVRGLRAARAPLLPEQWESRLVEAEDLRPLALLCPAGRLPRRLVCPGHTPPFLCFEVPLFCQPSFGA
uniref:cDNA FLJ54928, weakly similar to Tumor necrosis factor receptor type1-associated DEATH domain protein n=1 Tax=Homo sapiens TaxID=9606 RepID=B4DWM0_HUMAN|nr:unnamed protein product [Homo sapiens]